MILIVGSALGATRYITKVLKLGGLNVGHEHLGKHGMASWLAVAGRRKDFEFDTAEWRTHFVDDFPKKPYIIHQVRHPLDSLASLPLINERSWKFINHFVIYDESNDSLLYKCMEYWYQWNLMAEDLASWTYRVENLENVFGDFCKRIGRSELVKYKATMLSNSKKEHTRRNHPGYKKRTWDDLYEADPILTEYIKALAKRYGYEL